MTTSNMPSYDISVPIDFDKPFDVSSMRDKSVLITGGASGLGLGIATALAEAGAYITIADISTTAGNAAVDHLHNSKGLHVTFAHTDVTSFPSQTAAFKAAIAHSPSKTLDLVIPAAGIGGTSIRDTAFPHDLPPGADLPEPSTKLIDVNLTAVYYSINLALHYFKATRTGEDDNALKHILLISSLAGYTELPLAATYMAAKYGVRGMFKSMRDFGAHLGGIRVNLVAPYYIKTDIISEDINATLLKAGFVFATVADFVQGVLRVCCDEDVKGRAICIAPADLGRGVPGTGNFDVGDDPRAGDGAREVYGRFGRGCFGAEHDFARAVGLKP